MNNDELTLTLRIKASRYSFAGTPSVLITGVDLIEYDCDAEDLAQLADDLSQDDLGTIQDALFYPEEANSDET